jgi:excisionase family DNA binding protein
VSASTREKQPLLNIDEAAAYLNVPARWVADAVRQRKLRCTRIGKHVRFRIEHLEELIAAGEQPATTPTPAHRRCSTSTTRWTFSALTGCAFRSSRGFSGPDLADDWPHHCAQSAADASRTAKGARRDSVFERDGQDEGYPAARWLARNGQVAADCGGPVAYFAEVR